MRLSFRLVSLTDWTHVLDVTMNAVLILVLFCVAHADDYRFDLERVEAGMFIFQTPGASF